LVDILSGATDSKLILNSLLRFVFNGNYSYFSRTLKIDHEEIKKNH